ncbi:molybdopterin-guanine dinucleotide biosynthesis protein [Cellulomonas sp. WB94]|uniref:molybdenum cofactor guanylyltransferase n=1 Tax=Cellulomonas sp. WB94 TaxID=2173174 RepID=UPI000D5681F0|nr:NTP transferase domain-containing protein [Cellulomonas sp. WB94]PVU82168.1 molybdopterin-guanine dinucleotide biosynthesis protein [Cellulomonas sp. WB94]
MTPPSYDALVLAGGRARRLGGVSKPDVVVGGRRLLAHVLGAVDGPDVRRVVVVGPDTLAVPDGVTRTLEDPPDGGPVAGLAAGLAILRDGAEPEWVLVLACDVPRVAGAVPLLVGAVDAVVDAAGPGGTGSSSRACDGVVLVDDDGRDQPLVGLYRRVALDAAVARLGAGGGAGAGRDGVRGASVRALVDALDLVRVADVEHHGVDVDTWADVAALEAKGPAASTTTRGTMTGQADARPGLMSEARPDAGGEA